HIRHSTAARLLREYRAQQAAASTPVPYPEQACTLIATVPPAPVPLLTQAEQRLQAARQAEHAARKAWDNDRSDATLSYQLREAQAEHRKAQGWLDTVTMSAANLKAALPEAERTLLVEESQYASLLESHRKAEHRQAERVRHARQDLERLRADLQQ